MKGFVCLEKQEKLELLQIENIKFKELVLSDIDPFPGYYHDTHMIDDASKPKYAFVILKQNSGCYEDFILRAFYKIKNKTDYDFDASYGRISIQNKAKPCIRLKVSDYNKVTELISLFKEEGVIFEKTTKISSYQSNIKIRKFMTFTTYADDIYTGDKKNHYYIKIPTKQKWNDFAKTILSIKGSKEFGTFDAAQTSLYAKDEIIEFIRIYTTTFHKEDFIKLKDEILKFY